MQKMSPPVRELRGDVAPFWQLLPVVSNSVMKCFLLQQFPKAVTSVCFLLFSPYWEQGRGPPSDLGKVPPHV